ncbi:MAG TPA: hypothetical protein VFT64_12110 [Rickettsiales bacterium]|nr:hypothetical protein [Rickettsiales bacterium]
MTDNQLSTGELSGVLKDLGASDEQSRVTQTEVDVINFPYNGDRRQYHDIHHLDDMGKGDVPDELQIRLLATSFSLSRPDAETLFTGLAAGAIEEPRKTEAENVLKKARAILRIAGFLHDCAYKQIDGAADPEFAWPLILQRVIGNDLTASPEIDEKSGKTIFNTRLTEDGQANRLTRIIAEIFDVNDSKISTLKGGNEFDSAVVAAKLLEKHSAMATAKVLKQHGIDEKTILSVVACIAATYPFQSATESGRPDGYMGQLAKRMHKACREANPPIEMDWLEINKAMLLAVQTANDDVHDFFGGIPQKEGSDFTDIAQGAVLLKAEEITDLHPSQEEDATIQDLFRLASVSRSAPYLYKQMQDPEFFVQPENVPHFYLERDAKGDVIENSHYPAKVEYDAAVERVRTNTRLAAEYFEAKKVGVAVVAALEKLVRKPKEDPVRVLDFVHGNIWEQWPEETASHLNEEEKLIYNALAKGRGKGAVSKLEIDKSPTAGVVYGYAGREGMQELYNLDINLGNGQTTKLKDMENVETDAQAEQIVNAMLHYTGMEGLQIISEELARVAVLRNNADREKALLAIPERFRTPGTQVGTPRASVLRERDGPER